MYVYICQKKEKIENSHWVSIIKDKNKKGINYKKKKKRLAERK
jgi:hypothetical protein